MILLIIVLMLVSFSRVQSVKECKCIAPEPGITTRAGANEEIVQVEKKAYKTLRGVVKDANGEPLSDVLVEVLDNPEHLLFSYAENQRQRKTQARIAACLTAADGRFCFSNLPPGKYELLVSKEPGWAHTHVYIVVAPRRSTRAEIKVRMEVGT